MVLFGFCSQCITRNSIASVFFHPSPITLLTMAQQTIIQSNFVYVASTSKIDPYHVDGFIPRIFTRGGSAPFYLQKNDHSDFTKAPRVLTVFFFFFAAVTFSWTGTLHSRILNTIPSMALSLVSYFFTAQLVHWQQRDLRPPVIPACDTGCDRSENMWFGLDTDIA